MIDKKKLEKAVQAADYEFWKEIAKHYPEIETGDLCFSVVIRLTLEQEKAVKAWIEMNSTETTQE